MAIKVWVAYAVSLRLDLIKAWALQFNAFDY
jgi:hypothetical protein